MKDIKKDSRMKLLCRRKLWVILSLGTFMTCSLFYLMTNSKNYFPSSISHSLQKGAQRKEKDSFDRRGIRVIVGHYKADEGARVNFTEEELNKNNFHPEPGTGEKGRPVFLKPHETIRSKRLFHINEFNIVVSDKISLDRELEDVRSSDCKALSYNNLLLPTTSIIIVFHNEAWSTLLRTVHSALNTSPEGLIKEFILVDDSSERKFLKEPLEKEIKKIPVSVRLIHTESRVGLIQARLLGARQATGDVLTFLDAHCECTQGWLEPLLHRIKEDPRAVVCPVIDIINDDTFQYTKSFSLHWGAFNWELHFRWFVMGISQMDRFRQNSTQPYGTPVMAGGLFSINREYFWESGSYDEKMDIWGGENLEMSFRIWQCGGRVEISPCSRVGHIFRKSSPYTFPREGGVNAVLHGNLARLALTWLDDYKHFYFKINPKALEASKIQDVTERLQLRKDLKCNDFNWYLQNVWPQNFLPGQGRFFGIIRNKSFGQRCLQRSLSNQGTQSTTSGPAFFDNCLDTFHPGQLFTITKDGFIMTDENLCLDAPQFEEMDSGVRFSACSEQERQRWRVEEGEEGAARITHSLSGACLALPTAATSDQVTIQSCSTSPKQQWILDKQAWL